MPVALTFVAGGNVRRHRGARLAICRSGQIVALAEEKEQIFRNGTLQLVRDVIRTPRQAGDTNVDRRS